VKAAIVVESVMNYGFASWPKRFTEQIAAILLDKDKRALV